MPERLFGRVDVTKDPPRRFFFLVLSSLPRASSTASGFPNVFSPLLALASCPNTEGLIPEEYARPVLMARPVLAYCPRLMCLFNAFH